MKLLLHTEVRWMSKGNSLGRFVNMWQAVLDFLKFKSKSTNSSAKQSKKAMKILNDHEDIEIKSKIFLFY